MGKNDVIDQAEKGSDSYDFHSQSNIKRLAEEQGVNPVTNFEALLGDFWPDDETIEEFLETVYAWRNDDQLTNRRTR